MKIFKSVVAVSAVCIVFLLLPVSNLFGWGFWAHKEIHRHAIEALPSGLRPFFLHHADSIIARSVEADLRRNADSAEEYYHYINIDRYGKYPFKELPRSYNQAVKKFGKAYVDTTGTVPWRIAEFTRKLSDAMKRKDAGDIEFYASNLGHYIADANVPLHSTENYDGRLTGQRGIHSRWESRIPEKFGMNYKFGAKRAEYIEDPLATAFSMILESTRLVDSVLALDLETRKEIPESELYTFVQRDTVTIRVFSDTYYDVYHRKLNGMVERRMNDSIRRVAGYWYTAWVNAGKPKL